jgi:3-hydroxyacyl-CoA dehydrogenase
VSAVTTRTSGAVTVVAMNNPPVNGLGYDLRVGIVDAVDAAMADPAIKAVVLTGTGKNFSGGADIREFNSPKSGAAPNLRAIIAMFDNCQKPIVAAINGVCMGGGLELALGCHYRVGQPNALIALPEVKIGLLPGAGGTQRLPRLIGLEHALNMIVSGAAIPSQMFKGSPLFDDFTDGDVVEAAVAFAEKLIANGKGVRRVRDLKVKHPDAPAFLQFARNMVRGMAGPFPAPMKALEAVAGSTTMSFDAGDANELELFKGLMQTPESRALRHFFMAERAASKIPDVPDDTPIRPIKSAAVIGAGTMGGGIAMNFLNAGIPVTILEMRQEALDRGVGVIRKNYENSAKKGRIKPDDVEKRMGLLKPTLSYEDIANADLVIEAVFEDMGVKEQVFRKLDEVMKQGAILASNTSTLDVDKIAEFTKRPQDVIGMHFFSPANVMKLLEVVRGKATARDVLATVMKLAKTIRKTAAVSGVCDGFIGNRMIEHYSRQAMLLVEEGASPRQVDKAMESWGMAMGPFRMGDLAGNDVGWLIRKRRYVEKPNEHYSRIADKICELGRFGQKTGAGWYRYEPGKRDAIPDPVVDKVIEDYRKEIGVTPRKISDEEIVQRCIFALTNEGARIVEDGIALRASDIDVIYLAGYGFPLHRGGPMHYADEIGLANVARIMRGFARNPKADPKFWQPAKMIAERAQAGKPLTA